MSRTAIDQLIGAATTGTLTRAQGRELIERAPEALDAMLAAVRRDDGALMALTEFIRRGGDEHTLPVLRELALDPELSPLRLVAIEALGWSRLDGAADALVELLEDPWVLAHAAEALGRHGAEGSQTSLLASAASVLESDDVSLEAFHDRFARCREDWSFDEIKQLLGIVRGLARLGDHSLAAMALAVLTFQPDDDDPEEIRDELQPMAAETLQLAIAPDMIEPLSAHIRAHGLDDTGRQCMDALFAVATKEACAALADLASSGDVAVAERAASYFANLTGASRAAPTAAADWWAAHASELEDGVTYWSGEPLEIPALFSHLDKQPWTAVAEWMLHVLTDQDFTYASAADASSWWMALDPKPKPGALYRAGHPV